MAQFDPHLNFGYSLVATAPSPASSGTSLIVTAGQGSNFPDPSVVGAYNLTVCPAGSLPTNANAEIVRVSARAADTLTIARAQEGSSARTVLVGDQIFLGITKKVVSDIEAALDNSVNDFRLTLTSGSPVTTGDVTGAATLYCSPYRGSRIALYNSTAGAWLWDSSAEFSIALGTLVNAQAYDVFCYDSAGVPTLELLEWANATVTMTIATPCVVTWTSHGLLTGMSITFTNSGGALPTGVTANTQYFVTVVDANTFKLSTSLANVAAGTFVNTSGSQSGTHTGHQPQARQTALAKQDGVYVKSGATSRRYLGTFLTTATTTTEDSVAKRYLWNYYNRSPRIGRAVESTATWTYTLATYHQANASAANQIGFVIGVAEVEIVVLVAGTASNSAGGVAFIVSIGEDVTNTAVTEAIQGRTSPPAGAGAEVVSSLRKFPTVGLHTYVWLEASTATGTTTWEGNGGTPASRNGIHGEVMG